VRFRFQPQAPHAPQKPYSQLQLELQPGQLQQLTAADRVDLIVGLSKLVPKLPGVLQPDLYCLICEGFLGHETLKARDVSNIIRSMGSIADSTMSGGVSGALVAQLLSGQAGEGVARATDTVLPGEIGSSAAVAGEDITQQLHEGPEAETLPSHQHQQQKLLPPEAVVESLLDVVEPQLKFLQSRAMAMLLWGVRKLGYQARDQWLLR
jgi:hypothetical protein